MDIFIIDTKCAENIEPSLLESFRQKEISNIKKRTTHSLAYLMTDRILKEFYQMQEREIEFVDNKPFLKSRKKYFSISHSGEYIAIGFSDNNCGIDIEKNTPRNFSSIAERMKFKSKTIEDFYLDWTKYEAQYKLGSHYKSIKYYTLEGYTLCALSDFENEVFQIFIQSGDNFSNVKD